MNNPQDQLRRATAERVREEYVKVSRMRRLSLEQINRHRSPTERYCSSEEFVREWLSRADAVATFAVSMDLLSPKEAEIILLEFRRARRQEEVEIDE